MPASIDDWRRHADDLETLLANVIADRDDWQHIATRLFHHGKFSDHADGLAACKAFIAKVNNNE